MTNFCIPRQPISFPYVTGLGGNSLIAGLIKTDFFPEKASTKFKYFPTQKRALYLPLLSRYDSK